MFLDRLLETNRSLAELALVWQRDGVVLPNTYVIDLDAICENARTIKAVGDREGVKLYFMLKQLGRNPLVGKALAEMGFDGAVCVDYQEALVLSEAGVPLGNVGHLVQTPVAALGRILAARPDIVTVYSVEKAAQVGDQARRHGLTQPIMLRIIDERDTLYPGQYGGFRLSELDAAVNELERIEGVRVAGVCSFPCLLFSEEKGDIVALHNVETVRAAARTIERRGYSDLQLNMPSATCAHSIPVAAAAGATHMEPGHGLTGTTPYHAAEPDAPERIAYVYVSEVSHNLDGHAYCYGGGHYRRGHVENALVGTSLVNARRMGVRPPSDECIDYHFELSDRARVGDGVLMCFRTQMFVTRSEVAVVSGLSSSAPRLEGIFDTLGHRLR
ncbi:MAG TPA: alanine racemase [Candidatus Olsenella stercoravium]|uniref:Alanine racemase n=1 Tax=Candidatus Olsenella stercoravium TaxID=2838713 RepID=A0A9D2DL48_9ACTN|nr:alanine racemase [Candidatus Olsenella stercoravium]